jgi:hypothetical protein
LEAEAISGMFTVGGEKVVAFGWQNRESVVAIGIRRRTPCR